MTNLKPMLVIVIPTKNRRALLERAIGSVLAQDYANYRVVVVNDGSIDETAAYLAALNNPRFTVITHERSRGVNASRNDAFRELREGEWAVPLDDDDIFLPDAFVTIVNTIKRMPASIAIAQFNTIIFTPLEEYVGGWKFENEELWHDLTYHEVMTNVGLKIHGETRSAFKWTLFPKYYFQENINGFEGEWGLLVLRDGVGVRIMNTAPVILIDWRHNGEHLSRTAARRNPHSFAQAHARIFRAHHAFFVEHPRYALPRAIHALKIALRAFDPLLATKFALEYLRAWSRLTFT